MSEAEKYSSVWEHEEYRRYSPGEKFAWRFLEILKDHDIPLEGTLAEIGCGTGRAGLILNNWFKVDKYDLAPNCLDEFVKPDNFSVLDITKDELPEHTIGYCCDLMEHLPTEYVMTAVNNIVSHCDYSFFSIYTKHDHYGKLIGEELHLTVRPFTWWRDRLNEAGKVLEARDMINDCIFLVAAN